MDQSLSEKKKAAAKRRQKKWRLSPDEWEMLAKLCSVLEVLLYIIILQILAHHSELGRNFNWRPLNSRRARFLPFVWCYSRGQPKSTYLGIVSISILERPKMPGRV
jgi:hypothetical protein